MSEINSTNDCSEYSNEENNNVVKFKFPYKISSVDKEVNHKLLHYFKGERTGFVQVGPKEWFFPQKYAKHAETIYNFGVRSDDIWIVTFPRSGTTLTQEMVWMIANNCDFKSAAAIPLIERFPFLEFSLFVHEECKAEFLAENEGNVENTEILENIDCHWWEILSQQTGRRFIKTHLPFSLLPPNLLTSGAKIIYVARNVKDVAVSFYHLNKLFRTQGYIGDFEQYWDFFEKNLQPWTPYCDHIQEGWNVRENKNVSFILYEDIIKDMKGTITKLSIFLESKKLTNENINDLLKHLSIKNFKSNPSVNMEHSALILNKCAEGFIRKGTSHSSKDFYKGEFLKRVEDWIEVKKSKYNISFI